MATKYWHWDYSTAGDCTWASKSDGVHYDGWYDDRAEVGAGHADVPATSLPANGDVIKMLGVDNYELVGPADGPAAPLSLAGLYSEIPYGMSTGTTMDISIAAGGILFLGGQGGWSGTMDPTAVATFKGGTMNFGTLGDYATFDDGSTNYGTVGNHATFTGYAFNMATAGNYTTYQGMASQGGGGTSGGSSGDHTEFIDGAQWMGGPIGEGCVWNSTGWIGGGSYENPPTSASAVLAKTSLSLQVVPNSGSLSFIMDSVNLICGNMGVSFDYSYAVSKLPKPSMRTIG